MRLLVVLIATLGLLLVGVSASAEDGSTPAVKVTPASGTVDTWFTISGDSCQVGGSWRVTRVGTEATLVAGGVAPDEAGRWDDGFPNDPLGGKGEFVASANCEDPAFEYLPVTFAVKETPKPQSPAPAQLQPKMTG